MSGVTRIDQVREIILGDDYAELQDISDRVARAERRADDVAEVLPESIAASHGQDGRLVEALREPLRSCMASSVRDEPEQFANALFPIMGPAIRRAVAQALRDWAQQFNQALEHSLSPRGLKWRFQAWRAGVPFGQYVLQRTLLYRVEHVYLIQARTGRLIRHLHQADAALRDDDAVSAMFTAIQEFIRDAFSGDYTQRLRTAELGELTLWAVHGPSGVLVTVIRGVPPASLRATLEEVVESIDTRFGHMLSDWAGGAPVPAAIDTELARCLALSANIEDRPARPIWRGPVAVVVLLILVGCLYFLVTGLLEARRVERLRAVFEETPGVVVSELETAGDRIVVRGLRDPLAPTATSIAAREGWTGEVDEAWTPFLSLEPDLVIERARRTLDPPPGVELALVGETLQVTGSATSRWRDALLTSPVVSAGVRELDTSGLRLVDELSLDGLRRMLEPPAGVEMDLTGRRLVLRGQAPQSWLDAVPERLAGIAVLESYDLAGVSATERQRMRALQEQVAAVTIRFDDSVGLAAGQEQAIATLTRALREYGVLAAAYGEPPVLTVTGHTDVTGPDSVNLQLERRRAAAVVERLRAAGLPQMEIRTLSSLAAGGTGERFRGVTLELDVRPAGT